ncbi:MAG: mevalonate kinase [Methanomassiliicoccales archaeon]|jgi:mevalonate kinase|nr:mevalonate kinase [Methanomassiliicoccales archaeon]
MLESSAPGKIILFGEHAVVFGQPALALAISLRLRCNISLSDKFTVNGQVLSYKQHPYICAAIDRYWHGQPLRIEIDSDLPSGSGLGSSAAVTVSIIGAFQAMQGNIVEKQVAEKSFGIELAVQGRASPIDTSTCAHGSGIFINKTPGDELLWDIINDSKRWFIHHCDVPAMKVVVGYTGINAPTGPLVEKVRRFVEKNRFGNEVVEEIGQIAIEGMKKLRCGDQVALGQLMDKNQKLLSILGVSTPELEKLIQAAAQYSFGAKLTGAGGGGSIIALTDQPDKVSEMIKKKGGTPFIVETGAPGLTIKNFD